MSSEPTPAPDAAQQPPDEGGYTLAAIIMALAVMAIFMGAAVQSVSFQAQREREAELIFRGEQYVEAIRLYKTRYGRFPMRLKEIWEADPKVIRRPFKDPITDSENWGIVFLGQENAGGLGGGAGRLGPDGRPITLPTGTATVGVGTSQGGDSSTNNGLPPGVNRNRDGELIGPIVGVHSKSCDESIRIYEGRSTYCEWKFIFRENQQRGRGGQGGRPMGGGPGTGGDPRVGGEREGARPYSPGGDNPDDYVDQFRRTPQPPRPTGTP